MAHSLKTMNETVLFFLITVPILGISWKLSKVPFSNGALRFLHILMNLWIGSYYFSIVAKGQPLFLILDSLNVDFTGNYAVTASSIVTMILLIKFIPKRHD